MSSTKIIDGIEENLHEAKMQAAEGKKEALPSGAPQFPTREVELERSKIKVTIPADWTLSDNAAAQRAAAKNSAKFPFYLAQRICLFDGERRSLDWIESHIHGKDGLQLTGALFDDGDAGGKD